jgi:hypothetical protein
MECRGKFIICPSFSKVKYGRLSRYMQRLNPKTRMHVHAFQARAAQNRQFCKLSWSVLHGVGTPRYVRDCMAW